MRTVVVTDVPRPDPAALDALGGFGVATVHEAQGRTGYLGPELVARVPGAPTAAVRAAAPSSSPGRGAAAAAPTGTRR